MSIKTSIDYFSGIAYFATLNQCEEYIDDIASLVKPKDEIFIKNESVRIGEKFNLSVGSVLGMYGGIRRNENEVKLVLQLPGQFCRRIENLQEAIETFGETMRATRVDFALDDYKRRVSQEAIDTLAKRGDYAGVDSYELIASKSSQDDEGAKTCYFGSSTKIVRFYNAEAVHSIPADRWEVQLRGEYAEQAFCEIKDYLNSDKLPQIMGGMVTGAIDFVSKDKEYRSWERYEFWESLRKELPEIKLNPPVQNQTLEKALKWLDRQVGPTLSIIYFGLGRQAFFNYLENLAIRKYEKLTETQLSWVTYLQRSEEKLT